MTKIYLVTADCKYKDGWLMDSDPTRIEVFTNKKIALAYAEYWNLRSKKWDESLGTWRFKVTEHYINTIDYREDLIKLQIKNLPY